MKELSIEEKAKRYDDAIKLVNSKWYYRNQPCFINVSELFPEFKENKDENIRKWLIEYFKEYKSTGIEGFANRLKIDSIIAWLEKQINDEAIERAKRAHNSAKSDKENGVTDEITEYTIQLTETIFPELKDEIYKPKYCYILSYGLGKIFEHFIIEDEINLTTEELLKKYGFKEDECSIMYSTDKLELESLED